MWKAIETLIKLLIKEGIENSANFTSCRRKQSGWSPQNNIELLYDPEICSSTYIFKKIEAPILLAER